MTAGPTATVFPPFDFPASPRAALLVIDMQRCGVSADNGLMRAIEATAPGYTQAFVARVRATVIPSLQRLLACFRAHRLPVYFTAFASAVGDGSDIRTATIRHRDRQRRARTGRSVILPRADPATDVLPELAPAPGEVVLTKTSMDAFTSTALEADLRRQGVEMLVVAGVLTDACVESAARHAAELGFQVWVAEDACAAWEEAHHRPSLESLARYFARVEPTAAIVAALEAILAPGSR